MKVLVVEDAPRLRETLCLSLTRAGHTVDAAADGEVAATLLVGHAYDVIVLDLMLPGVDGLTLLARLRQAGDATPVLILTARDTIDDRVHGLNSGADDYLIKPFALAELMARLEALHRRRHGVTQASLHVGPVEIDTTARTARCHGQPLSLTAREYALLEYFALRPGRILTREQLEAHLYPDEAPPLSNAVDAAVYALRRKLALPEAAALIHTRRGLGYVFEPA